MKAWADLTDEEWAPFEARARAELEAQGLPFHPSQESIDRVLRLFAAPLPTRPRKVAA